MTILMHTAWDNMNFLLLSCNSRKVFGLWQASLNGQLFKYIAKIWGSIIGGEVDFMYNFWANNTPSYRATSLLLGGLIDSWYCSSVLDNWYYGFPSGCVFMILFNGVSFDTHLANPGIHYLYNACFNAKKLMGNKLNKPWQSCFRSLYNESIFHGLFT